MNPTGIKNHKKKNLKIFKLRIRVSSFFIWRCICSFAIAAISAIAAAGPLALAIGAVAGAAAAWAAAGEREIGEDGEAAEERGAAGTSSFEGTEANAAAKAAHVLAQSSPFTYTDVGGSGRRRSVSL